MARRIAASVAGAFVLSMAGSAAATTITLDNDPPKGAIGTFGVGSSPTYGQVFTAPLTGRMTSFTLRLNDSVNSLQGAIGTWNGGPVFGFGFGSPTTLYVSAPQVSSGAEAFIFTPNIPVVAGQQYVAFLTVFGNPDSFGSTDMPMSPNSVAGIDYFVWNNTGSPYGNASWDYFFNAQDVGCGEEDAEGCGDAHFSATFVTPEPSTLVFLGIGLIGLAAKGRRTRQ